MKISGSRNQIGGSAVEERNIIAGMLSPSTSSTPPDAVTIYGEYNIVQNNYIGKDVNGQEVWVCGRGISVGGAWFAQIIDNTIVNSELEAFGIYGSSVSLDAITMRGNILKNVPTAIEFGPNVPPEWTGFNPAKVLTVTTTAVMGTNGDNSFCPYCIVELFEDDADESIETLRSLGTTQADVDGNWTIALSAPLTSGQRLRTASTTQHFGTIAHFEVDTTSKFSAAYVPKMTVDTIGAEGGALDLTDDEGVGVSIEIPAGVFAADTTVTYTAVDEPEQTAGNLTFAGRAFDLDVSAQPQSALVMTITYSNEDLSAAGITDESILAIYYWDENKSQWDDVANTCSPASEYNRDAAQNTLSVEVCHLSSFGLFGISGYEIYLPVVMKSYGS